MKEELLKSIWEQITALRGPGCYAPGTLCFPRDNGMTVVLIDIDHEPRLHQTILSVKQMFLI